MLILRYVSLLYMIIRLFRKSLKFDLSFKTSKSYTGPTRNNYIKANLIEILQ